MNIMTDNSYGDCGIPVIPVFRYSGIPVIPGFNPVSDRSDRRRQLYRYANGQAAASGFYNHMRGSSDWVKFQLQGVSARI